MWLPRATTWGRPYTAGIMGIRYASRSVNPSPMTPSVAVRMVQDLSVSISVKPPIRAKIQKPLLFIQSPTIEPLPIAIARYTGLQPSIWGEISIAANMPTVVIIETVPEPCANFIKEATAAAISNITNPL